MEILRHRLGLEYPNIRRQPEIQGQGQFFQGQAQPLAPETQGIFQGMDPGVGATAALDIRPKAQQPFQGILEHTGHRDPVFLHLKAVVGGAFKTECEQHIHLQNPFATSRVASTSTR